MLNSLFNIHHGMMVVVILKAHAWRRYRGITSWITMLLKKYIVLNFARRFLTAIRLISLNCRCFLVCSIFSPFPSIRYKTPKPLCEERQFISDDSPLKGYPDKVVDSRPLSLFYRINPFSSFEPARLPNIYILQDIPRSSYTSQSSFASHSLVNKTIFTHAIWI